MTGAELLVELLVEKGVNTIFGYPGGAVLPVYDALFDCGRIEIILVRHEQAAVHAAVCYARAGQVPTEMIGLDSFQEVDIYGMTMSITKHNYMVLKKSDLPKNVMMDKTLINHESSTS